MLHYPSPSVHIKLIDMGVGHFILVKSNIILGERAAQYYHFMLISASKVFVLVKA